MTDPTKSNPDPDSDDAIDNVSPSDTNDESQSEDLNERYGNSA